ncbi:hypothetical protein ABZ990_26610 [Streptomyces sp. NPDC046203]|uniref:hypothetical protein n=1 Tax=Streptomyces sp. NPDC046203 TaxID=3154602 RepID=UPI0033ECE4F1
MMPQLPEDIIDRLNQMESRIKALSTAVNTRPALNQVVNGSFTVRRVNPDGTSMTALVMDSSDPKLNRPVIRVFDGYSHEIFADDIVTGGLARPWLQMLPPMDQNQARWPQTTSSTFTMIAQSFNPVWQPRMRLTMYTRASSGGTGSVKVLVDGTQFGPTVTAGGTYDYTGPLPGNIQTNFSKTVTVEIHAQATSGTVYAQPVMMHGIQT